MYVKRFNLRHLGHITGWLNIRGMDPTLVNDLPEIGYVVYDMGEAIAAAFLRQVEGGFALVDSAVSNPEISPIRRDQAMQLVSEACIGKAKEMGCKQLVVITKDSNTRARAEKLGFFTTKETVQTKKL